MTDGARLPRKAYPVYYELLHTDTFNVVGDYDTLDEALSFVRRVASERGDDVAEPLALARVVPGQPLEERATGWELLALARQDQPTLRRTAS